MNTIRQLSMTSALLVALTLPLGAQQGAGAGAGGQGARAGQTPPAGQEGVRGMRGMRGEAGQQGAARSGGPERILALRERLSLSQDQVDQLEALRQEQLEQRQERMAAMARIRSDVAAGQITPAEARARMQDERGEVEAGAMRDAVLGILTDEQRVLLQESTRNTRRPRGMQEGDAPRSPQGRTRPGAGGL